MASEILANRIAEMLNLKLTASQESKLLEMLNAPKARSSTTKELNEFASPAAKKLALENDIKASDFGAEDRTSDLVVAGVRKINIADVRKKLNIPDWAIFSSSPTKKFAEENDVSPSDFPNRGKATVTKAMVQKFIAERKA